MKSFMRNRNYFDSDWKSLLTVPNVPLYPRFRAYYVSLSMTHGWKKEIVRQPQRSHPSPQSRRGGAEVSSELKRGKNYRETKKVQEPDRARKTDVWFEHVSENQSNTSRPSRGVPKPYWKQSICWCDLTNFNTLAAFRKAMKTKGQPILRCWVVNSLEVQVLWQILQSVIN